MHGWDRGVEQPGPIQLTEDGHDAAGAVHVLDVVAAGATLQMSGTRRLRASMWAMVNSIPPHHGGTGVHVCRYHRARLAGMLEVLSGQATTW